MKTALECFLRAAKCEQMAKDTASIADRAMLRETARHWRTLADEAKKGDGTTAAAPSNQRSPGS
jgi:hypothetical protein